MKRLISWLLALTMIMSLPLSALAVDIDDNDPDVDVDFGELIEPTEPEIPEPQFFELTTMRQMIVVPAGGYAYGTVDITTGVTYNVVAFSAVSENWTIGVFRNVVAAAEDSGAFVANLSLEGMTPMTTGMEELTITYYNGGEEDAYIQTYLEEVASSEPEVGTWDNPATLILGENTAEIAGGTDVYYYTYTAEQAGTLVLEFDTTAAGWFYAVNNMTAGAYGDNHWSDDEVVVNPAEIEVAVGDELQIMVNTYDPADEWNAPAGTITINASYKAEGPLVDENLKFQTRALSFQEEIVYQCVFNTGSVTGYDSFYVECTHYDPVDGEYTENLEAKKMGTRLQFKKNFLSWSMVDEIKITLYGVKGDDVYMGESFVTSVKAEALSIIEAKKSTDTKTCRVLVDMLNYGAEVQKAFNHNASNPANADLGDFASFATSEMPAYSAQTVRGTAGSVKVNSLGISMQSKVEYQLVLANSNENHELRAYVDGSLYATVPYADFIVRGNFRQAKLAIKAADMRTVMQIAVYDKTTGEAVSETITTCAEAFATANIGEGKTYNDVFIAMLKYGDSVAALLG